MIRNNMRFYVQRVVRRLCLLTAPLFPEAYGDAQSEGIL